jgi:hypothetical protein
MTTGPNFYGVYAGQLVVDMSDSNNHVLVWRGLVGKTIDPSAKPDKGQSLAKAVAKLFKNYPPPPAMSK